jgi:hypothetical protein
MFLAVAAWTWAAGIVAAMLGALSTRPAGALLATPTVDLFTNNYVPTPQDTFSAYTVPTFTGYAAAAVTLAGPVNTGPATVSMIGTVVFEATANIDGGVTCYGCVLSNGSGTFYGAYQFEEPVTFVNSGDFLSLTVALPVLEILENNG